MALARLVSLDGVAFELPLDALRSSRYFDSQLEDGGTETTFPLPFVLGSDLAIVVRFLVMHHETPMPEIPVPIDWPQRFVDVVPPRFSRLVHSLSVHDMMRMTDGYGSGDMTDRCVKLLDVNALTMLIAARVSRMVFDKKVEQVHEILQYPRPFTDAEKAFWKINNRWRHKELLHEDDAVAEPPTLASFLESAPETVLRGRIGVDRRVLMSESDETTTLEHVQNWNVLCSTPNVLPRNTYVESVVDGNTVLLSEEALVSLSEDATFFLFPSYRRMHCVEL